MITESGSRTLLQCLGMYWLLHCSNERIKTKTTGVRHTRSPCMFIYNASYALALIIFSDGIFTHSETIPLLVTKKSALR